MLQNTYLGTHFPETYITKLWSDYEQKQTKGGGHQQYEEI